MFEAIKQSSPYKHPHGDILYGKEFIAARAEDLESLRPILPLTGPRVGHNPFAGLNMVFGVEVVDLQKVFEYIDPWYSNTYFWWVPHAMVIRNGVECYKKLRAPVDTALDFFLDTDWHNSNDRFTFELNWITRSMLGHGYTSGTLPSDGSRELIPVLVELDNGDAIFGYCWVWFNK